MEITSRLKLRKPALTDPEEEEDYNFNYDILDSNPGMTICTSTTRPIANLFLRQMIFETDTKRIYAWSGAEWIPIAPTVTAQMCKNAAAALPSAGWHEFDFDTIVFDTSPAGTSPPLCNVATNKFDIPWTGLWYFSFYWTIATSYPQNMIACMLAAGGSFADKTIAQVDTHIEPNNPSRGSSTFVDVFILLKKNDWVKCNAYNHHGGIISVLSGSYFHQFNCIFLGDQ